MDPRTEELLSRLMDGDLPPREAEQLEARLEREPELAAELEALKELRRSLRCFAADEDPPADLDRLLEPLRQSGPRPVRMVRPAIRWMAAAACIALGVNVGLEVLRRNPGPDPSAVQDAPVGVLLPAPRSDEDFFKLRPLPGPPEGTETVGVVEELLGRAEPEPQLADPEPLEVIGPLPEPIFSAPPGPPGGTSSSEEADRDERLSRSSDAVASARSARAPDSVGAVPSDRLRESEAVARPEVDGFGYAGEVPGSADGGRWCELEISKAAVIRVRGSVCDFVSLEGAEPLELSLDVREGEVIDARIVTYEVSRGVTYDDDRAPGRSRVMSKERSSLVRMMALHPTQGLVGVAAPGVEDGEHTAVLRPSPADQR
jgi:hypothetical protein